MKQELLLLHIRALAAGSIGRIPAGHKRCAVLGNVPPFESYIYAVRIGIYGTSSLQGYIPVYGSPSPKYLSMDTASMR